MPDLTDRFAQLPKELRARLLGDLRAAVDAPAIAHGPQAEQFESSFQQEQFWFVDRLADGRARNNVTLLIRLRGPLVFELLRESVNDVVARHDVLRTRLVEIDGRPWQEVVPRVELDVVVMDLSHVKPEERIGEAERAARLQAAEPFKLNTVPPLRARVLRFAADDHILVWTVHHVAWDPGSTRVLLRDLSSAYAARLRGEHQGLPSLELQYRDFAKWQRNALSGVAVTRLQDFWRTRLDGLEGLELPPDRPDSSSSLSGARTARTISDPRVLQGLKAIARRHNASLFMVMLAGFTALLRRLTNSDDVVVGTAASLRSRPELEPLIGCFINMLVLRVDHSEDVTFDSLVDQTRETVLDALANDQLPFELVVQALNPPREAKRHPLFQIEFAVFPEADAPVSLADQLRMEVSTSYGGDSRFDLSVLAREDRGRLIVGAEYRTARYEQATMEGLLERYERTLASAARDPSSRVSELDVFGAHELNVVLDAWSRGGATSTSSSADILPSLFCAQAAATPRATAVVCAGEQLTYAELATRADELASRLLSFAVRADERVGVWLERSIDAVVAVLAVLKSGAAYVPLDPRHPLDAGVQILRDAVARIVIADGPRAADLHGLGIDVVDPCSRPREDGLWPQPRILPSSLAYVIYTSGSTGRPKGVMIDHRALANFARAIADAFTIGPRDRVLQYASLAFDASVFDIFATIVSGAALVVARDEERLDPELLQRLMRRERVTVADIPPAMVPRLDPHALPDLRLLAMGGETFSGGVVSAWRTNQRRVVNTYGPTEATVQVTLMDCAPNGQQSPPIGRPMRNHDVFVLDRWQSPVPAGVPGEICIAGPGVARGYLGLPDATARAFVPNPFAREPGQRMYRTGDLGAWRPDGNLQFLGRIDRQVKIRGFRVEPAEIEAALLQCHEIAAAVVEALGAGDARQLVAYVVIREGKELNVTSLRATLSARLPAYSIPGRFLQLDEIPLTASGKIDRRALPDPGDARPALADAYRAPSTDVELRLARNVFSEVLRIAEIGVEDNFFELGGSSLQATQAVARARELFGVEVSLAEFFASPSVAALARLIDERRAGEGDARKTTEVVLARLESMSDDEASEWLAALDGQPQDSRRVDRLSASEP